MQHPHAVRELIEAENACCAVFGNAPAARKAIIDAIEVSLLAHVAVRLSLAAADERALRFAPEHLMAGRAVSMGTWVETLTRVAGLAPRASGFELEAGLMDALRTFVPRRNAFVHRDVAIRQRAA